MQFNIIFKTIFEYIHKKFRFVHTNTFCKYRKKLRASPRVHLVSVHMDQLSIRLNRSGIEGDIGGHLINHLCYADDLCLISLSFAGMQSLLDICNSYAIEHVLPYNSSKLYSLCFKPKHIKFDRPCFNLNRLEIPRGDQCKYLRIMICTKNCDINLKRQMSKFYANINILSRKFAKCSLDVKCTLFKSFCSNMYCSTMWYNGTVTAMRKLRITYNTTPRRLLGIQKYNSASEMFVQLNIKSFDELLGCHDCSVMYSAL